MNTKIKFNYARIGKFSTEFRFENWHIEANFYSREFYLMSAHFSYKYLNKNILFDVREFEEAEDFLFRTKVHTKNLEPRHESLKTLTGERKRKYVRNFSWWHKRFLHHRTQSTLFSSFWKILISFHHEMNVKNCVSMRRCRRQQIALRKQYET